jgi:uncharacterized repeat protein (TIGR03837 family)
MQTDDLPLDAPLKPLSNWDIFCNVVDNFGDIGVCWRLACNLAERGKRVRLWVDDVSPLAWMAPSGYPNVEVIDCSDGAATRPQTELGDVLVDAFDCEFAINNIATQTINTPAPAKNSTILEHGSENTLKARPIWLNLEYLTAESFAERAHTLPYVHHSGAAQGWTQRYFYPGFNERTGGLLRETDLFERQVAFDREAWLAGLEFEVSDYSYSKPSNSTLSSQRLISLFCYEPSALESLIDQLALSKTPTCLLVTHGRAKAAVKAVLEGIKRLQPSYLLPEQLLILYLPQLTQTDYDHLLWSCDLNFVRGEDSLVRAIWAAKPFIWQIYPQHDGAHHAKLDAFLTMMDAPVSLKTAHQVWNSAAHDASNGSFPELDLHVWVQSAQNLSTKLRLQDDLVTNLIRFVNES